MLWTEFHRIVDPWRDFDRMSRALSRNRESLPAEFPPLNVWIGSDTAVVTTELPGVETTDIDISVVDKTLTIRGSRKSEEAGGTVSYHRKERWQGQFSKSFDLPFSVNADRVEANFRKGVLTVTLPIAETEKPRRISVRTS